MHLVLLLWSNGRLRIPVGFRLWLWRPRRSCRRGEYRTKVQLAQKLILEVLAAGLSVEYVAFDSWYTARWFCKLLDRLGLIWLGELKKNGVVVYQHRRYHVESW
jgi:SRSO17 transposase